MFKLTYASSEALLETLNSVASAEAIVKVSVDKATAGEGTVIRVDVLSKGNAEQVTEGFKATATADINEPVKFEAKAKAVATKLTAVLGTIDEEEAETATVEFKTGKSKLTIVGGLGKFETELLSSDTELLPRPNIEESLAQITVVGKDFRSALLYGSRGSADSGADSRAMSKAVTFQANLKAGMLQVRSTNGNIMTAAQCKANAYTKEVVEELLKKEGIPVDDPKAAKRLMMAEKMAANREATDANNVTFALPNERVRALAQFLKSAEAVQILISKNIITIQGGPRFYGCTLCAGTDSIFPAQLIQKVAEVIKTSGRITVGSDTYAKAVGNLLTATEGDRSKLKIKMTLEGEKTLLCTSSDNGELKVPVEKADGTEEFKGVTLAAGAISSVLKGLDEKIVIAVGGDKTPVGFYNAESPGDGTLAIVSPINPEAAAKAEAEAAAKADKKKAKKADKPKEPEKPVAEAEAEAE